jgi:hypothetical protein
MRASLPGGQEVELDFSGLSDTERKLRELAGRVDDMRPATRVVRDLLVEGNRKVFESKGAAVGRPWPDLKPGTLARKARAGIPSLTSVLVETGELEEAALGGRGSTKRATRSTASAGVNLFYAVFQMKLRPPIGLPREVEQQALTVFDRFLARGAL